MVSVPNIEILSNMLVHAATQDRFEIMKMMFGGQEDEHAYHRTGYYPHLLGLYFARAGFVDLEQVETFNLFEDASEWRFNGTRISLNVKARKPL